ncbi:hypothetical protein BGZ60DRAFT_411142 [Tricladium varicosporioides]|nr:hypothetical protein BGZ60DRAFT_411142 [Hymenoscyphus varicosporioides]
MTTSKAPHILLLGGHGKIALLLTPKILSRSWDLTSVIRNPDQKEDIVAAGNKATGSKLGKLNILVESLDDVKSVEQARGVLERVRPDWILWSAGAGGKGGPTRTNQIDRYACQHFIRASIQSPTITKFLLVSALSVRRSPAPWWSPEDSRLVFEIKRGNMEVYLDAKLASDECLTVLAAEKRKEGGNIQDIILRPGTLSDVEETGKVVFGKTGAQGVVSRGNVAEVAVRLLEGGEDVRGWFDVMNGEGEVETREAIQKVLSEKIDCVDGEDFEVMKNNLEE